MQKFVLYLGLLDKDTKNQKFTVLEAYKTVESMAVSMFEGATVSESHGVYKHADGTVIIEPSLRIELYDIATADIHKFADMLKVTFNQESILVESSIVQVNFL